MNRSINFVFWTLQGLMRELELREKKVNDIQALGDKLVKDGHPGRKTVEVITLEMWAEATGQHIVYIKLTHRHRVFFVSTRPSHLPCRLSGAGSSSCAAV